MAKGRIFLGFAGIAVALGLSVSAMWRLNQSRADKPQRAQRAQAAEACRGTACESEETIDNDVQLPFLPSLAGRSDYRYQLDYAARMAVQGGQEIFDLKLAAELSLSRIADGEAHIVRLQLSNITPRGRDSYSAPEFQAFLVKLSAPIYGRYQRDGELVAVHAPAETDATVLSMLMYLLADLQLQAPRDPAIAWEAEETDTLGIYAAVYRRKADRAVSRAHLRYLRMHDANATSPEQQSHTTTFSFSKAGRLDTFASRATTLNRGPELMAQATTELRATYSSERSGTFAELPAGLKTFPIRAFGSAEPHASDPLQPAIQLAKALRTTSGDSAAHFHERARLAERIKNHPAEIPEVLAAINSALDGYESARLIAALTAAGTPEAIRAVADIARDPALEPALREQAVTQLAVTERPNAESLRELDRLAQDANLDDQTRNAALLGLGANLRNAPNDTVTAEQREPYTSKLVDQAAHASTPGSRRTAITALGNVGGPEHFSVIEAALSSPNPVERAAAVFSLRHINTREAELRILAALTQDSAAMVRSNAADALATRLPQTPPAASGLLKALAGEQDPNAHRSILTALAAYLPSYPELRPGLQALAERSASSEFKRDLEAVLAESAAGLPSSL
jgi:HEAT repeat protein